MKFFQTMKDSIYNPQFYKDLKEERVGVSIKYFAKLAFLTACIVSIVPIAGGVGLLTWKQSEISGVRTQVVDMFPQELSMHIENGEISTTVAEPYVIAMPDALREKVFHEQTPYAINNLLVINTQKPIETIDFQTFQTFVIVGKNEIGVFNPEKGKFEIQSLHAFDVNYTLDRHNFETLVGIGWKALKVILVIGVILLPFIIFTGLFVGYLVYLLFGALAVWFAASLVRKSLSYGQAYQLGLHLVTLPFLMSFLLPSLFHIPFLFTVVLFAIAYANFRQPTVKADTSKDAPVSHEDGILIASDTAKDVKRDDVN